MIFTLKESAMIIYKLWHLHLNIKFITKADSFTASAVISKMKFTESACLHSLLELQKPIISVTQGLQT